MTPIRADLYRAGGASLIFHTVLLLSLAAVFWIPAEDVWQPVIESRIADPSPSPEPLIPELNLKEFLSQSGAPAAGPKVEDLLVAAPLAPGLNLSVTIGSLSGDGGVGAGGAGGVIGGEKGLGFFGSQGTGKSVVFVVDMSGSMEGARFGRAQQELVKSIHQLHVTQKFYVIFFNKHAVPLFFPKPPGELVTATPSMKRSATRWIVERRPAQGTEPEAALTLALSLKPEVIYFLTDGEFPERCRQVVKERNTFGAIVHTIALQSREGIPLLEAIAADNNGSFKLVK